MNFDLSDDQREIKRTARELLTARVRLREHAEAGTYDDALWTELVGLGWPGIGVELGAVELVVLAEELGYALAPVPFLSTAAAALALAGDGRLPDVVGGRTRATVGEKIGSRAGLVADVVDSELVVLLDGDRALLLESPSAVAVETIDSTRRFGSVEANDGTELAIDVAAVRDRIALAVAAESVGVAQRMLEGTVAYAKEREQFGQPIGIHQAVSHRCAQMLLETECARSACLYAAWAADHEPASLPLAASSAKAYASDAGYRVTAAALQLHGGIGFTWEHDLHFFLKRARVNGHLFGSAREHRERVATLICA
ncbi:MAG TPA: acyl-CoA dehydrogenase [Solirubrobacteraceae bacterium]|nr:acyl-CoA dehydrogenase [Solirubrobacteraceae bacterium]